MVTGRKILIWGANMVEPLQSTAQPTAPLINEQIPDNQDQPQAQPQPQAQQPTQAAPNTTVPTSGQALIAPTPNQQAQPPQTQKPPATPQDQHAGLFRDILAKLGGGGSRPLIDPATGTPKTDANGQVVMQPASKKTLGASILAGALSGLMAGFQAPKQFDQYGHQDLSGAAKAGVAAGQAQTQAGQQKAAQQQADDQTTRQFAITDHNLKTHAAILNNLKLQGSVMDDALDNASPIIQGMQAMQDSGEAVDDKGQSIDLIKKQNISGEELQQMMSSTDPAVHVTKDQIFPDGKVLVTDPDGGSHYEYTYTVYDPKGQVKMTDALRKTNPELTHVSNGQSIPVQALAKYALEKNVANNAGASAQQQLKGYYDAQGSSFKKPTADFDLKDAAKKDPVIKSLYPMIGKYSSDPLDLFFKDLKADKGASGPAVDALMRAMNVTPDGLQKMADQRAATLKAAEKGDDAQAADFTRVDDAQKSIPTRWPKLTPAQVPLATSLFHQGMTNASFKKAEDDVEHMQNANINAENARAKLTDTETNQLLNTGRAGSQTLTTDNASPEMMIDQRTGQPVPFKLMTAYAPTMQEKNRKDFANTTLHAMDTLAQLKQAGKLPNGPITGLTAQGLMKLGLSSADAQQASTTIQLLQTAATGAHVAGRFSVPVLDKMSRLMSLNMNDDQFQGAIDGLRPIMQNYVDKGGSLTVYEWNQLSDKDKKDMINGAHDTSPWFHPQSNGTISPTAIPGVPHNKVPGYDKAGKLVGYADDNKGTNFVSLGK